MGLWKTYQSGAKADGNGSGTPYQDSAVMEAQLQQQQHPTGELTPTAMPPGDTEDGPSPGVFTHLFPKYTRDVPLPELTAREQRAHRHLKRIQWLMDESVPLPWSTSEKPASLGIDPIIGLVPVIGDIGSAAISLAFVARASPVLSRYTTARMLVNVGIDAAVGIVPIVGDLFDFGFKANTRNMAIFEDHMKRGRHARKDADRKFLLVVTICFIGFLVFLTLVGVAIVVLIVMLITGRL